jgi:hypothetical protein
MVWCTFIHGENARAQLTYYQSRASWLGRYFVTVWYMKPALTYHGQFPHADAVWISSVRSLSWPAPALPVTTTKTTTTSTKTTSTKTSTSTKPAATGCSTLSAWNPTTTYVGGDAATYGSRECARVSALLLLTELSKATHRWNAQWWTLVRLSARASWSDH